MTFSKRFPREVKGSSYPRWEEIKLSDDEERAIDASARQENMSLLKECINDAKTIAIDRGLKPFETSVVQLAIALFEKRSSHVVYHKEQKAKDKFDQATLA